MKVIATPPKLVAQVHEAIVSEISASKLKPGERVIQEQIALILGVSRQPAQQPKPGRASTSRKRSR